MKIAAAPNLAGFLPALQLIDPQGIKRQAEFYFRKLFDIFGDIINHRLEERGSLDSSSGKNNILEAPLEHSARNESEFSCNDLKHLLTDLFVAGTDTTATTPEWAAQPSKDGRSSSRNS